jgi:hypothetical protein
MCRPHGNDTYGGERGREERGQKPAKGGVNVVALDEAGETAAHGPCLLGLWDPGFEYFAERFPYRLERDPVEDVCKEAPDDDALGLAPR